MAKMKVEFNNSFHQINAEKVIPRILKFVL